MDFDQVIAEIKQRAADRRESTPELELELDRLEGLPRLRSNDELGGRHANLTAELHLANLHFNPCQLVPGSRFSLLKRIVLRIARLFMNGQVQFNASSVRALNEMHRWVSELSAETELLRAEQRDLLELVRLLEQRDRSPLWESPRQTRTVETLRKDLLGADQFPNMLGFLERFRGSEELVRDQQRQYLELFDAHEPVADLGCGRGEFLALLSESAIDAIGVEPDPALAAYVRSKGLPILEQDMFEFLRQRKEGSLGGVFAAQVIEHLDWRQLLQLLELIQQRLATGGLLVLESINPVCLSVFSEALYVDPTHIRPYHPAGIEFLCNNLGFSRIETRFSAPTEKHRRLHMFSEYQHYAIIARK